MRLEDTFHICGEEGISWDGGRILVDLEFYLGHNAWSTSRLHHGSSQNVHRYSFKISLGMSRAKSASHAQNF